MNSAVRVTHLIGTLGRGGAEKQIFCLATALQKRGWPQSVIAFDTGGVWRERFEAAGVELATIPRHPLKPWRLWQLRQIVRRQQSQVLVSWSEHVGVYAHWLWGMGNLRRIFNVRIDLTTDIRSGASRTSLGRFRRALEKADWVLSNSRRNLEALAARGLRMPPSGVIYNIVTPHGRARPEEPVPCPRIVSIGTLIPRKAHDVLLASLAHLARAGKQFELLIAGQGPERGALEELAARLEIADRVRFLGDVDDVPGLLASAHVLAHPARSEGLSNVILEAMAEGVPVVTTPVGATPELITDGTSGLLVAPGNVEPLAAAIQRLLDDPALRGRLGREGLRCVQQHCSEERVTEQYIQVFRSLSGASREPAAT